MIPPVVKVGTLVLKTVAKPIAFRLKKAAGRHPTFRQFIINIAQVNHRVSTIIQRRIYSHVTDVEIRPLNEEKAVQVAGDLIGELFVFSVATAALIFEVHRSARSEARKEKIRQQEIQGMKRRQEELEREVEVLTQKYSEIEQLARGRGLSGILSLSFGHGNSNPPQGIKEVNPS